MTATPEALPTSAEDAKYMYVLEDGEAVFDFDAYLADRPQGKPFKFSYAGRQWELPHFTQADIRVQARIENASDITADDIDTMFGRMFGADQAEDWARVPQHGAALVLLFQKWVQHAKDNPVEDDEDEQPAPNRATRRAAKRTAAKKATPAKATPVKKAPRKATT